MGSRQRGMLVLLLAALAAVACYSYWRYRASIAALTLVARDMERCEQLAADIGALRNLPQFAVLAAESAESTADRIQEAAETARLPGHAGVPGRALARIQPQEPYRLSNSAYLIRPYQIELDGVTLPELIEFAHHLIDEPHGLTVRDLRFWDPSRPGTSRDEEVWDAQLILTQLIFSPISRQSTSLRLPSRQEPLHDEIQSPPPAAGATLASTRSGRRLQFAGAFRGRYTSARRTLAQARGTLVQAEQAGEGGGRLP